MTPFKSLPLTHARFIGFVVFCLAPLLMQAQPGTFTYNTELGGYVSSNGRLPFWLRANQWGQVPLTAPAVTARLGLRYQSRGFVADSTQFGWELGTQGVTNASHGVRFLLPQAYLKLRWRKLELMAGREREILGIMDSTLSSGSYSWSGNALPIPLIRLGIREYAPLGFLGNFISIKGFYAHGWYNNPYIQGAYFHQKAFHSRFGKPEASVHVHFGLVHNTVWGGKADYLKNNPVAVNGKLTTSLHDYVTGVVLGQIPKERANDRFTEFDGTNRVGNHVGHYDLALDWQLPTFKLLAYRQHPFEDASGLQIQNLPDGLYGLSLRREASPVAWLALKGVVLEYLHTKDQSGQTFEKPGSRFKGLDNYFNHAQYREGWSYRGRGVGTPFVPSRTEVAGTIEPTGEYFPANRVVVYHLGLEGLLVQKVRVLAKLSYSRSFGTINVPFPAPIRQLSSILDFESPLFRRGETLLHGQIAYDRGGLYPKALGGYLGIRSVISTK
jgi:hypothetical protein